MAFRKQPVKFSPEVIIQQEENRNYLLLSEEKDNNIIVLQDGYEYEVKNLSDNAPGNKGGHSFILRLFNPHDNQEAPLILKICAYTTSNRYDRNLKILFEREIKALNLAKKAKCRGVIGIVESGELSIDGQWYNYYVMEYAESDLSNYLLSNPLDFSQKLLICYDLLLGIQELHKIGVYHRDIKHDNLLICNKQCKLADLGLAKFQDEESIELRKKLGAYGWEAPEAINKYYVEREVEKGDMTYTPSEDCVVDSKSDSYQIAKVFWFVFNNRVPNGQLVEEDFVFNECSADDREKLYSLIHGMLLQNKDTRTTIDNAIKLMTPIVNKSA